MSYCQDVYSNSLQHKPQNVYMYIILMMIHYITNHQLPLLKISHDENIPCKCAHKTPTHTLTKKKLQATLFPAPTKQSVSSHDPASDSPGILQD